MAEAGGPRQRQAGSSRRRAAATAAVAVAGRLVGDSDSDSSSRQVPKLEAIIQIAQRHRAAGTRRGSRRRGVGNT
jgi:hypothetical protein